MDKEKVRMKKSRKKEKTIICIVMLILSSIFLSACSKAEVADSGSDDAYEEEEDEIVDVGKEKISYVDTRALVEVEKKDDFEVKVTDIEIKSDALLYDNSNGSDAVSFQIFNGSEEDIVKFEIYAIAYQADRTAVKLLRNGNTIYDDTCLMSFYNSNCMIGSRREDRYNIGCHAEDFYNVHAIVSSYETEDGTIYQNPNLEEWENIVYYGAETEDYKLPPEGEYDEIVLEDDRYYLCKKTESGFDQNMECYGIYDGATGQWALEYRELPLDDISFYDFNAHGDGVFSYIYSSYYGKICFLSAELGDLFKTDKVNGREKVSFQDGKALIVLSQDRRYVKINGESMLSPDRRLCWLNTQGQMEDVVLPEFGTDGMLYWSDSYIVGPSETAIYARKFDNYNTGECKSYIYFYFYDDDTYTIIEDQNYSTRVPEYLGDEDDCSNVELYGDVIYIDNLQGEDGEKYYAEFDRKGNVVTKATLMN